MTIVKGFRIIILSGFAFGLGGGLIGYTLGVLLPNYYRGAFRNGREPWFDPVAAGVGLGLSQGLMFGLLLGAVVVLAVAWYNSQRGFLDVRLTPDKSRELQRRLTDQTAFHK